MKDASIEDLDRNPWPRAADYIEEHGWTKDTEEDERGAVCIQGAVRLCSPKPGDGAIHREVLIHRHKGAELNDAAETTVDDILGYLRREAAPITDDELLEVFGPQWLEVVALVRETASWSDEKIQQYNALCWSAWNDPNTRYAIAWRAVGFGSGPGFAARRALRAIVVGDCDAGVAAALARRHEIGVKGGIHQQDYDALCKPWREFTGTPVHPDDAPVVSA